MNAGNGAGIAGADRGQQMFDIFLQQHGSGCFGTLIERVLHGPVGGMGLIAGRGQRQQGLQRDQRRHDLGGVAELIRETCGQFVDLVGGQGERECVHRVSWA